MYSRVLTTSSVLLVILVAVQLVSGNLIGKFDHTSTINAPHNLTVGRRIYGDKQLVHSQVKMDRRFLRWVETDYKYPHTHYDDQRINITFIQVVDLIGGGEGGYPTLTHGGPGTNNATIHLVSKWNRGIDFNVTIYGKHLRHNGELVEDLN